MGDFKWLRVKAEEVQPGDKMPSDRHDGMDTVKGVKVVGSQVRLRWDDGSETLHPVEREMTVRRQAGDDVRREKEAAVV